MAACCAAGTLFVWNISIPRSTHLLVSAIRMWKKLKVSSAETYMLAEACHLVFSYPGSHLLRLCLFLNVRTSRDSSWWYSVVC